MASRPLTYRERVQNILHEVALSGSDDILAHIRDGISAEIRARRVWLGGQGADSKVVFTAHGKRFYQEMGGSMILAIEDKRLMRMTIPQLHEQSEVFSRVIREIKHLFAHFRPQDANLEVNEVPNAVRQLFHRINNLNQQWTDIQHDLATDQAALRDLRANHEPLARINSPSVNGDGSAEDR
uniref:Longiborneol synthase CLM1 (Terpene cyclase CLM1)) n=1 Tax=Ganoderma boninense TaxID=34458 RepID=A0A5K1K5Y4_9APHY|nr:Longiborneol synthase CLM1 (EC (Culmorin biosynthesis protein 1) (Terpene cyclase CLM1) [Ganoderma boninense]